MPRPCSRTTYNSIHQDVSLTSAPTEWPKVKSCTWSTSVQHATLSVHLEEESPKKKKEKLCGEKCQKVPVWVVGDM